MKRLPLLLLGLLSLLSFSLFSRFVKHGGMKEVDFAVTVKVQERIDRSSRLRLARLTGEIMEGSSSLASPTISIIVLTVITLIRFIKLEKKRVVVLLIPIAFVLMTLAEIYGKSVVHHPAPPFFLLKNPVTVFPKYYVWEEFSYPSGHAARAVFIAVVLFSTIQQFINRTVRKRLWIACGLGIYIGLVSLSRIYLGHHWLSDVIGGWLLGAGSGLLTNALVFPYNRVRL